MIKTVFSDKTKDKMKVFTAYDSNYKPIWNSKEYRIDTELVKQQKDFIILRTILGYEAYKIKKIEGEIVSIKIDYNDVITQEEIKAFDEYYKSIHPNANHPEIDLTPEETYKLFAVSETLDETEQLLDEQILKNTNELEQMRKELEQIQAEKDRQAKQIKELEYIADEILSESSKHTNELIKKLKDAESKVKYYEDIYSHWADWYKENKVAIQTLKHEGLINTVIFFLILNLVFMIIF